uniref:Uncharacterized protein n=1 Tax=Ciona savignyi TaxID=51511 RepID=H2YCN1_CIOSA
MILEKLSSFKGKIECEAPNNHLHKFTGNMVLNNQTLPIDNEKILLRGCTLRNTDWCFGLIIFAGSDTKLMQNTGRRILKRTSIERFMNKLVWLIFVVLFLLATLCAILNSLWESDIGVNFQVYSSMGIILTGSSNVRVPNVLVLHYKSQHFGANISLCKCRIHSTYSKFLH